MITFEKVKKIAFAMPCVEESTSYGTPALKVRGKLMALMSNGNRPSDPNPYPLR